MNFMKRHKKDYKKGNSIKMTIIGWDCELMNVHLALVIFLFNLGG